MWDALDVVHPVEAEQQLLAVEAPLQLDDLVLDRPGLQLVPEDLRVDPDGERVHRSRAVRRVAVYPLVAVGHALGAARAQHARARGVEMAREVIDVEAAPGGWCAGPCSVGRCGGHGTTWMEAPEQAAGVGRDRKISFFI